jgi:dTDP-4-dehydrorhamnose reductase
VRVLVAGAAGMVGQAVNSLCALSGDEVLTYDHHRLDIADNELVRTTFESDRPDIVINCAAWTDVDGCEGDPERAHRVNALGPENLARASRAVGAGFITISTDYVFDGRKDGFYTQRDDPNPESVYAVSKLEGERRSQLAYARSIIVRSGFIFGANGRNFLSTVVDRARTGTLLKVISDAQGTPTYAPDLAAQLRKLAMLDLPGVYHIVNAGNGVSFEGFTLAALEDAGIFDAHVESISMDSLRRLAARPRNSRLHCLLSDAISLVPLRSWREALKEFVASQGKPETAASK